MRKFINLFIRLCSPFYVAPIVAAGASAGATSSTAAGVGAAATSGGMGLISSVINQGANKKKQERQQKYTRENMDYQQQLNKEMADYNNQLNVANWKLQNEREDYLLRNGKAIETQALRDAGFNPSLAYGVGQAMPTSSIGTISQSAGGAPMGAAGAPSAIDGNIGANAVGAYMQVQQQQANLALAEAQVKLMGTQADKNVAETQGQQLENSYFGAVLPERIGADKSACEKARLLNGLYIEHPEALEAIVKEHELTNQAIQANIGVLNQNINVLKEQEKSLSQSTKESIARESLYRVQSMLTRAQYDYVKADTFKLNYTNPTWIINEQYRVEHSTRLSADEKNQIGALLQKCYDEVSGQAFQKRTQDFQSSQNNLERIHESKMQESEQGFKAQIAGMQMDEQIREYNINSVIRIVEDIENVAVPWLEKSNFQERQFAHDFEMQSNQQQYNREMEHSRQQHDIDMQNNRQQYGERMEQERQSWENTRDVVRHGWDVERDNRRYSHDEIDEYYDHNGTYTGGRRKSYHKR